MMYTLQNKYMKNFLRSQTAKLLRLLQNDFMPLECGKNKNSAGSMKSNFSTFHFFCKYEMVNMYSFILDIYFP